MRRMLRCLAIYCISAQAVPALAESIDLAVQQRRALLANVPEDLSELAAEELRYLCSKLRPEDVGGLKRLDLVLACGKAEALSYFTDEQLASRDAQGATILHRLGPEATDEMLRALVARLPQALVEAPDERRRTPLMHLVERAPQLDLSPLITASTVAYRGRDGLTPLAQAAELGHPQVDAMVEALIGQPELAKVLDTDDFETSMLTQAITVAPHKTTALIDGLEKDPEHAKAVLGAWLPWAEVAAYAPEELPRVHQLVQKHIPEMARLGVLFALVLSVQRGQREALTFFFAQGLADEDTGFAAVGWPDWDLGVPLQRHAFDGLLENLGPDWAQRCVGDDSLVMVSLQGNPATTSYLLDKSSDAAARTQCGGHDAFTTLVSQGLRNERYDALLPRLAQASDGLDERYLDDLTHLRLRRDRIAALDVLAKASSDPLIEALLTGGSTRRRPDSLLLQAFSREWQRRGHERDGRQLAHMLTRLAGSDFQAFLNGLTASEWARMLVKLERRHFNLIRVKLHHIMRVVDPTILTDNQRIELYMALDQHQKAPLWQWYKSHDCLPRGLVPTALSATRPRSPEGYVHREILAMSWDQLSAPTDHAPSLLHEVIRHAPFVFRKLGDRFGIRALSSVYDPEETFVHAAVRGGHACLRTLASMAPIKVWLRAPGSNDAPYLGERTPFEIAVQRRYVLAAAALLDLEIAERRPGLGVPFPNNWSVSELSSLFRVFRWGFPNDVRFDANSSALPLVDEARRREWARYFRG